MSYFFSFFPHVYFNGNLFRQGAHFRSHIVEGSRILRGFNIGTPFGTRSFSSSSKDMTASDLGYKILASSFEKPELDDRNYRYIQLPNRLKVFLIQDKSTDKAAAALDVNVGFFQDPEDLPGLAHFCEHLLFMGSEKFPNENEYSSYLSHHGGASNAYTSTQNTNYYFMVNHGNLYDALDRFSGFFTSPLFSVSSTNKEVNAVDSENKKNLQSDLWRMQQLDRSLTNPGHPFHKFSTGNYQTLYKEPKSRGIEIREELLKFYDKTYSANLMRLVILGMEDLDTLSAWAYELFKDVPDKGIDVHEYNAKVFTPTYLTKIIKAKPIKDLKRVEVSFDVPDTETFWDSRPADYISHLIGHESSNSLLSYLISQSWATELYCGAQTVSKGNAYFCIHIELTDKGVQDYEEVVYTVFQYIEMLKKSLPQERIFVELNKIGESKFRFKQKGSPSNTVSSLAKNLQKDFLPPEIIFNASLIRKFKPELIMSFLSHLQPKNSRISLISRSVTTNLTERWYGTEYAVEDYDKELLKKLEAPELNPSLQLPTPNMFIPTNFDVNKQEDVKPLLEPLLLKEDRSCRLWYKKDDRFWVPEGHVYVSFKLPHSYSSVVNSMLSTLYVEMVKDSLKDLLYNAECANFEVSFVKTNQGLDLSLTGYNDKMTLLLTSILEGIRNFDPKKERFDVLQKLLCQKLYNRLYNVPYSQIGVLYNSLINDRSWTPSEKLKVTKQLTFEHFKAFVPSIYEQMYFETLVHGNFPENQAIELNSYICSLIPNQIKHSGARNNRPRSYMLPEGKTYRYETTLFDEENVNSCFEMVIQLGMYSEDMNAKGSLLAQLINEPCFNTLRTEEQLGYVVWSSKQNTHASTNLRILVQSESDTVYIESRVDKFLNNFADTLRSMSEQAFEKHKGALCNTLLQKFKNMREENFRFIGAIFSGDYNFLCKEREAKIIRSLTQQHMIDFYERHILSQKSSKLNIHLKSQAKQESTLREIPDGYPVGETISEIEDFKSSLFLAPARPQIKRFELAAPKL
ncbi:metalloendopeptidase Ecym_3273 [Eremothecium cymbalariae DBVPG|uniref:Peptidase M16 N-terminal domain-containing protein n=1 Tax=Eremothecium cymbalariae (strain CBS 270.75 / DBVPG 7215 / KCTC 17166 / NRRL Y-17582) TaxID=931890 RepID=G8JRJ7_ERECY|nr:Hypothetical protein Ecym_3273 [Eremothecium cymbalariae DBVPG\